TIQNNNNQSAPKNNSIQNHPPKNNPVLHAQTNLQQIMDNLSKLEKKFQTLSEELIATKNISKELQQGQANLFLRVENIEQICNISPSAQQIKPKLP
ncbi:6686_t:CDS:1, partial [Funneliformis geosporum]